MTVTAETMKEHEGLVVSIAKKLSKSGVPMEDLIQTGQIGLIVAMENFNPTIGVQFSTYAYRCIWSKMMRLIVQNHKHTPIVTSELEDFDVEDTSSNIDSAAKDIIGKILPQLSQREREVLTLRYGLGDGKPMDLKSIGERYGVTKEAIRQTETKALAKARQLVAV